MAGAFWTSDFEFERGRVTVRTTGANIALDGALVGDALTWMTYYVPVRLKGLAASLRSDRPSVWFGPQRPRPWYLVWLAACWSGVRFARSQAEADAAFYFEDSTFGQPPACDHAVRFNFDCADVSKTRVAEVFEAVFGYALAVDPTTHSGPAVEKGEANGAHDGRIVQCPTAALPGRVYQKVVDNTDGDQVLDLRTPCVGGSPVLTFLKKRPVTDRFANYNTAVSLTTPDSVFSPEELATIGRFCMAMRLDWGGLDILRDRADGRLYIVDVNKTDMPPLRLPWRDKMRAVARLAAALTTLIKTASTRDRA
jgi:hypothetical protein